MSTADRRSRRDDTRRRYTRPDDDEQDPEDSAGRDPDDEGEPDDDEQDPDDSAGRDPDDQTGNGAEPGRFSKGRRAQPQDTEITSDELIKAIQYAARTAAERVFVKAMRQLRSDLVELRADAVDLRKSLEDFADAVDDKAEVEEALVKAIQDMRQTDATPSDVLDTGDVTPARKTPASGHVGAVSKSVTAPPMPTGAGDAQRVKPEHGEIVRKAVALRKAKGADVTIPGLGSILTAIQSGYVPTDQEIAPIRKAVEDYESQNGDLVHIR